MSRRLRKPSKRLLAQLAANKRRNWTAKKLKDQDGLCYWCAKRVLEPTCDHLVPLSRGGADHYENVVAAHEWCNLAKGDLLPEEFSEPGKYDSRQAFLARPNMSRMDATAKREAWNRREVAEWIGATPDSKVPDHVRQRVFLRHHGMCHIAKRKIRAAEPWDLDHVIALRDWTGEGHGNRESNLAPALKDKHRAKTAEEATARATVNRKQAKHIGSASSKRAFWDPKRKRTVSGRVVER